MNKLEALLEKFSGTNVLAPIASGVTHAEEFGCMCKSKKSVMHSDCVFDCDEYGEPIVYCDSGGSDN